MRLFALILLLLTAPTVFAQEDASARQVLDECIGSLDADVIGIDAIEETCPGIEDALLDLGLTAFIPDWQWQTIGVEGLRSLHSIEQRYREVPDAGAIQTDSLQSVLDSLQQPVQSEQALTWSERFQRWLRNALNQEDSASDSWLGRWLEEHGLPDKVRNGLFIGAVVLIVLLALIVIVNEVRVARNARRKSKRDKSSNEGAEQARAIAAEFMDVDAAALGDRPSIVLRMLVDTLMKTGRLPAARSLTNNELTTRAKFDDSSQREVFRRIAQLAERVVYGGEHAISADFEEVVQAGRTLNTQLAGTAT